MSVTRETKEILDRALALPPRARAELVARLIDSLEPDDPAGDVEAAWRAEIERRLEAIDEGRSGTISWEEARRRIESRLDAEKD